MAAKYSKILGVIFSLCFGSGLGQFGRGPTKPTTTTPVPTHTPAPEYVQEKCANPKAYFISDRHNCSAFFACEGNGQVTHKACPPNTIFTPRLRVCTIPQLAKNPECGFVYDEPKITTEFYTLYPTEIVTTPVPAQSAIDECNKGTQHAADPEDCTVYYLCIQKRPERRQCPPGSIWTPKKRDCRVPTDAENSVCNYDYDPTEGEQRPYPDIVYNECKKPNNTYTADPDNCSTFYQCYASAPIIQYCPPGTIWAPKRKKCLQPHQATNDVCGYEKGSAAYSVPTAPPQEGRTWWSPTKDPNSNGTSTTIEVADYIKEDCAIAIYENRSFAADAYDCFAFWSCGGTIQPFKCAAGTVWSIPDQSCQIPQLATNPVCGFEAAVFDVPTAGWATSEGPDLNHVSTDPPHPYAKQQCQTLEVPYAADPTDCQTFYQCNNGIPVKLKCAPGSIWATDTELCTQPFEAKNDVCGFKYNGRRPDLPGGPLEGPKRGRPSTTKTAYEHPETTTPNVAEACKTFKKQAARASAKVRQQINALCGGQEARSNSIKINTSFCLIFIDIFIIIVCKLLYFVK